MTTHLFQKLLPAAALSITLAAPASVAWADAAGDLANGRTALAAGDLDKALPLLTAAAEALPESVEARLALAECQLKLGRIDQALAGYRAVLKLSPNHALAGKIVASLSGQQATLAERVAAARALAAVGAFAPADSLLARAVEEPAEPAQRHAARLLLAEIRLNTAPPAALVESLRLLQETNDPQFTGPARVLAALVLAAQAEPQLELAAAQLQGLPQLAEPWASRAALARLLIESPAAADPAVTSGALAKALSAFPPAGFRQLAIDRFFGALVTEARERVGRGDAAGALAILWPMVSSQPLADDQLLKPLDLAGGWLGGAAALPGSRGHALRKQAAQVLAEVGRADWDRNGPQAKLLAYWAAGEVLRQRIHNKEDWKDLLWLAGQLTPISRPAPGRKPGTALSAADAVQRGVIRSLAERATDDESRAQVVDLIAAQLGRYHAAGDLETGLAQFITVDLAAKPVKITWAKELAAWPPQGATLRLWQQVGGHFAALGARKFGEAQSTLTADANVALQPYDAVALLLAGEAIRYSPESKTTLRLATQVLDRYGEGRLWKAVSEGATLFYAGQPADVARWAVLELKLRQASHEESIRLAANLTLGKQPPPLVKEALADALTLVSDGSVATRDRVRHLASTLVGHYADLDRLDLAEGVIATVSPEPAAGAAPGPLADWALWTRAALLERQAQRGLALAAARFEAAPKLPLAAEHKAELELLGQLLAKFPQSDYRTPAVEQVVKIANTYQHYQSFATARVVLTDFLKTQPKLSAGERLEFAVVSVSLAEANAAFAQRKEPQKVPAQLLPEHVAAIDALAAFLKAHPTGDYSAQAEQALFGVARTYGHAGAWPVVREVLEKFATAIPDYRSPAQLKFWRAATYLGELDGAQGIKLLSPGRPGDTSGALSLALAAREETEKAAQDFDQIAGKPVDLSKPGEKLNTEFAQTDPAKTIPRPGIPKIGPPLTALPGAAPSGEPSESSLALIKQAQQQQFQKLAMLEGKGEGKADGAAQGPGSGGGGAGQGLPSGSFLTDVEMKRQDVAADAAYAILIDLVKSSTPAEMALGQQARGQILWLFGFFEGQSRGDRAIALIARYLVDQPNDPAKVALAFQSIGDRLTWASQRQRGDRLTQAWLDERHKSFDAARAEISTFLQTYTDKPAWVNRARLLAVESYEREAQLALALSPVRAGGLLVRAAEEVLLLLKTAPDHPECPTFPQRLWNLAQQLQNLAQHEQAIYIYSQIPNRFPTDTLANQAVLAIAHLYAASLAHPLKAVETYQEYLSLAGDDESVHTQIFSVAQQLASKQRYLEALHVYGVFVDSFPTDPRAADALRAIGQTHQANEAWTEAITAYQRVLSEYGKAAIAPAVKLAIAECRINLSQWRDAARLYEEYLREFPKDGHVETAKSRLSILKNLDRYQTLLADQQVTRNKDDAQFQIGRIVLEQLSNPVKAIIEFKKVAANFPKSDLADDAQLEIGRALLGLDRLEEARAALLALPTRYPNSPLADDALFLIANSYEQQAQKLANVTLERALADNFERGQRGAYQRFNEQQSAKLAKLADRRDMLKKGGRSEELALEEASTAFFAGADAVGNYSVNKQIEMQAECDSALQVANRQDKINDAYREAVSAYVRAATDYPLGDRTDASLLRIAQIFENQLKDRKAAMETYQRIVKMFPGTPVAEDAAWKVAQFYEDEGKHQAASEAYREFIRNYPGSPRVAEAQFAMAETLESLGQWIDAMDAYETFRQKFAAHPKAKLALEQINWIKAYRK